jgi:hypothetical protein
VFSVMRLHDHDSGVIFAIFQRDVDERCCSDSGNDYCENAEDDWEGVVWHPEGRDSDISEWIE